MWSPAWLLPALPGRNVTASSSVVLSHHTPSGWNPKPPLNAAAACSFSEWADTNVASTSSTTSSARSVPATLDAGTLGSSFHTWRRVRARAFSTRFSAAGVASSNTRHTVGADATGPNSPL
jgi:hypothetical protein